MSPHAGRLIVFEGIDGSGKSTQVRRLAERLRAMRTPHSVFFEPTRMTHGAQIRRLAAEGREAISPEREAELFRLDRMDDVRVNLAPALARGEVVLLDRYYFSTMAYQGALGLDIEQIRRDNEAFAPPPDIALYFDLDPDRAIERIRHSRRQAPDLFERAEYLAQVRAIFQSFDMPYWRTLNAAQPPDVLERDVWALVEPILLPRANP